MTEIRKRKAHRSEFKAEVGLEGIRGLRRPTRVVRSTGFTQSKLGRGRRRLSSGPRRCSRGSGGRRWWMSTAMKNGSTVRWGG